MDYAKSFTYVFDDPRWKEKIAWGAGLTIISFWFNFLILGVLGMFILAGYSIRLLQNVRKNEHYPLPEWDDWGGDFVRGAKYALVAVIWALPMLLLAIPSAVGWFFPYSNDLWQGFGFILGCCSTCLMVLYGIFLAIAFPGFSIAYAKKERITDALQLTDIWRWSKTNLSPVIVTVLLVMVAQIAFQFVAALVGLLLICIGLIVTLPLGVLAITLFSNHLYGQLALSFPYGESEANDDIIDADLSVQPDDSASVAVSAEALPDAVESAEAADEISASESDDSAAGDEEK